MLRLFDFSVICYEIKNGRNILVWLASWGGSLPGVARFLVSYVSWSPNREEHRTVNAYKVITKYSTLSLYINAMPLKHFNTAQEREGRLLLAIDALQKGQIPNAY